MKIILSRKGFDSSYGGMPSPILPDGRMLSLPIPSNKGRPPEQCRFGKKTYRDLIDQLRRSSDRDWKNIDSVHLDPDLEKGTVPRSQGWKPSLGQTGAAKSHLKNQGVGPGDLFLFYGWFKRTDTIDGELRFIRGAPSIHCIFGWLQVESVLTVMPGDGLPTNKKWLADHPHVVFSDEFPKGSDIYVAKKELEIDGIPPGIPGGGAFHRYRENLRLTAPDAVGRSEWLLPSWFVNKEGGSILSYNTRPENWSLRSDGAVLRAAAKGQEFVFDGAGLPQIEKWVHDLLVNE